MCRRASRVCSGARALVQRWHASGVVRAEVGIILALGDDLVVGIVQAVVEVGLVADDRIGPPIVDTESNEIDLLALDAAAINGGILLLEIVCKFWAVVASIRLRRISLYRDQCLRASTSVKSPKSRFSY